MNIGIIGSGGREHSLCFKLIKSKKINKIYCLPGNAGTDKIATNIDVNIDKFDDIYESVISNNIELLIVGPEVPLVNGIVDFFVKRKIKIFGPSKKASQLEGSKIFMKNLCKKFNIPAANFKEIESIEDAINFIDQNSFPIVVKSDGLAAGKGVTIRNNKDEVLKDVKEILNGKFNSSRKLILEEFLEGEELSYFVISDGNNCVQIGTAQDHKRIGENDTGPNTGGMGAYSPSYLINEELEHKILENIIKPTIAGMNELGCSYKGILYAGLMIKNNQPKLIEYNIRFGDPECQVLMMRLENDLLDLILLSMESKLSSIKINWSPESAITIVASNKGYPGKYNKTKEIKNLDKILQNQDEQLFHAGTSVDKYGKIIASGGRVLNATVKNKDLKIAREKAISILNTINWEEKYFRKDIGYKAIYK